jgi:putative thioredoxin
MEQLLEIIRRDRSFRNDAARKTMLQVFNLLGNEGELVSRYRRLMAAALN